MLNQSTSSGRNQRFMWLMPIVIVVLMIAGFFIVRNRGMSSATQQSVQTKIVIPHPDTSKMEPQVAAVIHNSHQILLATPNSADAWGKYGMVLDAHILRKPAAICYQRAHEMAPDDFRWPYLLGLVLEHKNFGDAGGLHWLQVAAKLDPNYTTVFIQLGYTLNRHGKLAESIIAYEKALELDPSSSAILCGLGQAQLSQGDHIAAISNLEYAVQLAPDDRYIHTTLATAYTHAGFRDRAQETLEQSRSMGPRNQYPDPVRIKVLLLGVSSVSCLMRADQYFLAGEYLSAIKDYEMAVQVVPNDPNIRFDLAKAYWLINQKENALLHMTKGVELDDSRVYVHIQLGRMMMNQRKFERAVHHFHRASIHDPEKSHIHELLAIAMSHNGQTHDALKNFGRASELGTLKASAEARWGTTLLSIRQFDEAAKHFTQAIKLQPDFANAYAGLGVAMEGSGKINEAIDAFEYALKINPEHRVGNRLSKLKADRNISNP